MIDLFLEYGYLRSTEKENVYRITDLAVSVSAWSDLFEVYPETLGFPFRKQEKDVFDILFGNPPCQNEENNEDEPSDSPAIAVAITLENVVGDAGLRLVFHEFLQETLCEENLYFYEDLMFISLIYKELRSLEQSHPTDEMGDNDSLTSYTSAMLYQIKDILSYYIGPKAAFRLNIDYLLSQGIECIVNMKPPPMAKGQVFLDLVNDFEPLLKYAMSSVKQVLEFDSLPKFCAREGNEHYIAAAIQK